jgi:hypothetical protein
MFTGVAELVAEHFQRTELYWSRPAFKQIAAAAPDVVIFEIIERALYAPKPAAWLRE